MKRRFATIGLLVTALAALVLTGPVQAKEAVPFKAHGTGVITFTGPPGAFSIIGVGQATHFGRYTASGSGVLGRV
jgi:hypothetical protein